MPGLSTATARHPPNATAPQSKQKVVEAVQEDRQKHDGETAIQMHSWFRDPFVLDRKGLRG